MNVSLHIERLVLEGLPLKPGQASLLRAAVEQELGRLARDGSIVARIGSGGARAALAGGSVRAGSPAAPTQLGTQIARAVASGVGDAW